ncbi:MAG: hypothetical protein IT386_13670 [Deltaproteobacteria bacterium]|nr:hypothetical protein [Deltaproteobacteria bacterium]
MARGLADVLHYFIPEVPPKERAGDAPAALRVPIVGVPLADGDVVGAALVWNLAVEVARLGCRGSIVAPATQDASALWPEPGQGPLGTELVLTFAEDIGELATAALDVASTRSEEAAEGGFVLVRVPPAWLEKSPATQPFVRRVLVFASPDRRDLVETYALIKRCFAAGAESVGVTIHGVRSVGEAEQAFLRLARACERHLGQTLASYGLLVDDLHVYRSIVSRRPLGLTHPHSPAARTLRDVARLVFADLRGGALA